MGYQFPMKSPIELKDNLSLQNLLWKGISNQKYSVSDQAIQNQKCRSQKKKGLEESCNLPPLQVQVTPRGLYKEARYSADHCHIDSWASALGFWVSFACQQPCSQARRAASFRLPTARGSVYLHLRKDESMLDTGWQFHFLTPLYYSFQMCRAQLSASPCA